MSCAACANAIDATIRHLPGVSHCVVNFSMAWAEIAYNATQTSVYDIQQAVSAIGYGAHLQQSQNVLVTDTEDDRVQHIALHHLQRKQDLRTYNEFSGFRTISRGRSPREIIQLRKSYLNKTGIKLAASQCRLPM